jgi:hypothetical protein
MIELREMTGISLFGAALDGAGGMAKDSMASRVRSTHPRIQYLQPV